MTAKFPTIDPAGAMPSVEQPPAPFESAAPASSQLHHTHLLASITFFMLLKDGTWRLRTLHRLSGMVLGSALLAELIIGGWIEIDSDGTIELTMDAERGRTVPDDLLTHKILEWIKHEPPSLDVGEAIAILAADAVEEVVDRLTRANLITVESQSRMLGLLSPVMVYRPGNGSAAAWHFHRLASNTSGRRELGPYDVVLAGLLDAAGLLRYLLATTTAADAAWLRSHINARMADNGSLVRLVAALERKVRNAASQLA